MYFTRIIFNTEDWKKPSGLERKSRDKQAFINISGFSLEEWFFDETFSLDGHKYGFLEAIANSPEKREKHEKMVLFTIDGQSKLRYKIAELSHWNYVSFEESKTIADQYKEAGHIKAMRAQVAEIGADTAMFDKIANGESATPLFNIHFEFKNLNVYTVPIALKEEHPLSQMNQYVLYDGK